MEHNSSISKEHLSEIKRIFGELDKNKDGRLSASEFVRGGKLIGINLTKEKAKKMILEADKSGSGFIEYVEFEELMQGILQAMDKLKQMHMKNFKKYDKDGSGSISFEELRHVLKDRLTDQQITDHFYNADIKGDGKISFDEFVKYFCEI